MNIRNLFRCFIATILIALLSGNVLSCSKAVNHKIAYGINISGQEYIKLSGKRQPLAHSPGELFQNSYPDSILIAVPSLKSGVINGKDIPAPKGYYNYLGTITINGKDLNVDLLINNADDKKLDQFGWNGNYKLTIK